MLKSARLDESCTTVNLHDRYFVVKNDIVTAVWNIEARGKFL